MALPANITNTEELLLPQLPYQVQAIYSDPDGALDLADLYFSLINHTGTAAITFVVAQGDPPSGTATVLSGDIYLHNASIEYQKLESSPTPNDITVSWRFTLNFLWIESSSIEYGVRATDDSNNDSAWDYTNVNAYYTNSLDFAGQLSVADSNGARVQCGTSWLLTSQALRWTGLHLVYKNTSVAPPDEYFDIRISDDDSDSWIQTSGSALDLWTVTDALTDGSDLHIIDIVNLPPGAIDISNVRCGIRVTQDAVLNVCDFGCEYSSIQNAINAITSWGIAVLVHDGTYYENVDFLGKPIAVTSQSGSQATTIDAGGSGSVVAFSSIGGSGALLQGFTLTNGSGSLQEGGGITCSSSSATISDFVVRDSGGGGGGIAATDCSLSIRDCLVTHNSGSGIYLVDSAAAIDNCLIGYNSGGDGGGVYLLRSSGTLSRSSVVGNMAFAGGGIYFEDFANPEALLAMENVVLVGNFAWGDGGALFARASVSITNSTISDNRVMFPFGCNIRWDPRCGITCTPTLDMVNSISWGSADLDGEHAIEICIETGSGVFVDYSDIEGGDPQSPGSPWPGIGNIDVDPGFLNRGYWDPGPTANYMDDVWIGGEYRVEGSSGCVDAGTAVGAPMEDITGAPRPLGGGYEMGAYEFDPTLCGDVNDDGLISLPDISLYRDVLAASAAFSEAGAAKCKVIVGAEPCGILDLAVIRRKVEGPDLPPGTSPVCPAAASP